MSLSVVLVLADVKFDEVVDLATLLETSCNIHFKHSKFESVEIQ